MKQIKKSLSSEVIVLSIFIALFLWAMITTMI